MARPQRLHCRECDRHVDECGPLSARYRCIDCGKRFANEVADQLHEGEGPAFDYWLFRTVRALAALVPPATENEEA